MYILNNIFSSDIKDILKKEIIFAVLKCNIAMEEVFKLQVWLRV